MAFDKNIFNVARKKALEKKEISVECNIQAGATVTKVLTLSVDSGVNSSEVLNDVVNFSWAVDIQFAQVVLFLLNLIVKKLKQIIMPLLKLR